MSIVKFRVIFDKRHKVYYSGEILTGKVKLVLRSETEIRGIQLRIVGTAHCKFQEQTLDICCENQMVTRNSSEICINNKKFLIGGKGKFKLPAGEYTYPFATVLPNTAHTSFKGSYGEISYYAEAKIYIPYSCDIIERNEFTVIRPLNLKLFPSLRKPYEDERSKTYCCLWCSSGPLTVVIRLPRIAFAATEPILFMLDVDNKCSSTVSVLVYLKREICYLAEGSRRRDDRILQNVHLGTVEGGQSHTFDGIVPIPSISFPNLDGCTIIRINHTLHIEAIFPFWGDLKMWVPITIVDVLIPYHSKTPKDSEKQTFPKNMAGDPGIQTPAAKLHLPHPNHTLPVKNHSHPENIDGAAFGRPSQICPSADASHVVPQPEMNYALPESNFSVPSLHQNVGKLPIQGNSVPDLQYPDPPQAPPVLHSLISQPATNAECSQNASHHQVADFGFTLPSINSDVKLEKTSFFSDSTS